MSTLLRIDSSARVQGSHSRELGDHFEKAWLARHPADLVLRRDLAAEPIPQITAQTIAGFYTPADKMTEDGRAATALSDNLIAELQSSDVLLLTVPMYNFSIPAALKAWIDQVVRIGQTFSYNGTSFAGLVTVKQAYVLCSYGAGGYLDAGPLSAFNLVEPYLKLLLGFVGISQVQFFAAEATTADDATVEAKMQQAKSAIDTALV